MEFSCRVGPLRVLRQAVSGVRLIGDSKLAVGVNVSGCFFVSALQHPCVLLCGS